MSLKPYGNITRKITQNNSAYPQKDDLQRLDLSIINKIFLCKMNIKRVLLFTLVLFTICLFVPKTSQAFDLREALTSENSIVTKIQEGIEYFFAFKVENKVAVLDKQAEKRLDIAQDYADKGNDQKVQGLMQNFLQIKEKQGNLLEKITDGKILDTVEGRTIEQQKTMEDIKTKIDGDGKQNVIKVQEQVVNQVAKRVIDVNGKEGATEFLNEVVHVWAPGTGPGGGEAGIVYAGGGKLIFAPGTSAGGQSGVVIEGGQMKFAPGTSAGGSAGSDIKNVEVKTGGVSNEQAPVNNSGSNLAPGTTQGGSGGNTIDPGVVDQGTTSDSKTWIAP